MDSLPKTFQTKLFINNEFVESVSKKTFAAINPSTGAEICQVYEGDKADVDLAVLAARTAFQKWRNVAPTKRALLLNKLADLFQKHFDELAALETLNMGKPLSAAQDDIEGCISVFRYYAGYADKLHGKTIPMDGSFFAYTTCEPIGVCAQIIPWNYPLLMLSWKIGPALACGNCIVMKPAEQTPLSALRAAELIKEAGYPAGVFNVINGFGETAGAALSNHPDVDKIAFTGSTSVGRLIMQAAAKTNLKKVTLELGGKSPLIILDDANLDNALQYAYGGIFSNSGQVCCASSRVLVQEGIYDKFVEQLATMAKNRQVGDPFDIMNEQGPLASEEQYDRVLSYIKIGKDEGAKCVAGGDKIGDKGFFVQPTVFADVKDTMKIANEEIFGPVLCVMKFKTIEDGIKLAHKTVYGLAAGIFSENISNALMVANALRAGTVWVNCYDAGSCATPFGGFKQSGTGRELGEEGLKPYYEVKSTIISVPKYKGNLEELPKKY